MKTIVLKANETFNQIPLDKYAILVRDGIIHQRLKGNVSAYQPLFITGTVHHINNVDDIRPNDALYQFDDPKDIYSTLSKNQCLDRFKVKLTKEGEAIDTSPLREIIENGGLVGITWDNKRFRVVANGDALIFVNKSGKAEIKYQKYEIYSGQYPWLVSPEYKFISFADEYELFAWLHKSI